MFRRLVAPLLGAAALVAGSAIAVTAAVNSASAPVADSEVAVVGTAILAGPASSARAAAPIPGCDDKTYALSKWQVSSTFQWSYNPAGAPASVTSTALGALQNGTQTVASGRNRCGPLTLRTSQAYLGATTRVAQVSASGACTGNDNKSVVSWGSLPSGYLAYTCVYYRPTSGAVLASDLLIDNKAHAWATTLPAKCSNVFDLESVAVHERGHTFGLSHVDQARSALQVMSPKTPACSTAKRLLAAGDAAGLAARYR